MMHAHKRTNTRAHTSLEALMNLDAIGTEAELKGGGSRERDRWIKSEEGQETEGRGNFVFSVTK